MLVKFIPKIQKIYRRTIYHPIKIIYTSCKIKAQMAKFGE